MGKWLGIAGFTWLWVTSALHMPRARAAFERVGLQLHPAPTDLEVIDMPFDLLRIDAEAPRCGHG